MLTLENRTKTVTALRSGEFKQARHSLQVGEALCCIGVAYTACIGSVPEFCDTFRAARSVGFDHRQEIDLINLNDFHGKSFAEIADVIETFPVTEAVAA